MGYHTTIAYVPSGFDSEVV